MRWRATWMPPRLETLRWTARRDCGSGSGAGEADALETVPLAGRDGAGQGAPQDAVLGDDVHDLAVEADAGSLPGQRGADLDDLLAQSDDPGGVDQPLHFHAAGRGQDTGRVAFRGRSCPAGTILAEPGEVNCRQPRRHGLDPPPCDAQVHGGGVDPEPHRLAGSAGAEPELLRTDVMFPDGGITRSTSTASGQLTGSRAVVFVRSCCSSP